MNGKPVDSAGALTPQRRARPARPEGRRSTSSATARRSSSRSRSRSGPTTRRRWPRGERRSGERGRRRGRRERRSSACALAALTPQVARELGSTGDQGVVVARGRGRRPRGSRPGSARGDVILEVNRQPVKKVAGDGRSASSKLKDGDMALLRVRRGGAAVSRGAGRRASSSARARRRSPLTRTRVRRLTFPVRASTTRTPRNRAATPS